MISRVIFRCGTEFQDCDGPLMDRSACNCLQSKYENVKPHTNKISQVTSVMDPQVIMIVSHQRWMSPWGRHGACQMCCHICLIPCPATMLLRIAAVLARKQGTPKTTRGTFEGKTRSDGTNPLWRACRACRNLKGTRMISQTARCAVAALVSTLGWSGSMFAVGVDILHSTFEYKFAQNS